jgi:hypothetical protein
MTDVENQSRTGAASAVSSGPGKSGSRRNVVNKLTKPFFLDREVGLKR